MKIVFMGTPEFAAAALKELIKRHEVTAVITQPDKPVGRGKKLAFTPVKEVALEYGIEVYQPQKIKAKEFAAKLAELEGDIFVVVAYGQILSKEILDMPKYGSVNIHASLLPKYRGSAPIQWAVINGERESGITIIQMDEGIDTGDMLLKEIIPIAADETGESLHNKLAALGSSTILKALELIEDGNILPTPQDDCLSSYAPMLKKETGQIDWNMGAVEIERLIRGLYPWPSAFSTLPDFGIVKIIKAEYMPYNTYDAPGTILDIDKKRGLIVAAGKDALLIEKIQISGKKVMDVPAFLLGNEIKTGMIFL
ncbi:MAG: methionyl-tRNA formyltransferase [Defluviitaleaceae bacterium]|nr:methionyl-tRNA formyltransferase [Defluviitaleaceae bacterium]